LMAAGDGLDQRAREGVGGRRGGGHAGGR
jgi:hypothetical protein